MYCGHILLCLFLFLLIDPHHLTKRVGLTLSGVFHPFLAAVIGVWVIEVHQHPFPRVFKLELATNNPSFP